ncbi:TraM recognition domain-containing protein [Fictibacillus sp. WQ 8-8]|uniref:type IV secretory system conjugative DNA transfer family protein n=1 Tax=Fictibacillus sp. WQ 8-8 TaxID=2938788 RepID=UPI002108FC32|nr:TraM recognition domain-containing protein [Fictibacillus sp. WQ 8-8]MCQ6266341.1 TraM recognition domain-containing protein [Fictibacillus sp. WQ 8-8]
MPKSNEDLGKEFGFGFGMLAGVFAFFPIFVFSIPFYIFFRTLKRSNVHVLFAVLGFICFCFLLYLDPGSYLGLYSILPFDLQWMKNIVEQPMELSFVSLMMYGSGGLVVSFGWSILTDYYRAKRVKSLEESRDAFKESSLFQKVKKKRYLITAKEQKKWRNQKQHEKLLLGITEDGKPYYMDFHEVNQHMFVPATTGGGKTILLLNFVEYALMKDLPFLFIDGKGSAESINEVESLCRRYGKELKVFSDKGQFTYNPLKYGGPTVIKDKLEQLIETESDYYSAISTSLVQALIQFIDDYGFTRDLWTFAKYLDPEEILTVLNQDVVDVHEKQEEEPVTAASSYSSFLPDETKVEVKPKKTKKKQVRSNKAEKHYDRLFKRYRHEEEGENYLFTNASSVRTQIFLLLDSELGHLFEEKEDSLDLLSISEQKEALFVSFDGLIYDKFIKVMARFLILDINYLVSYRNRNQLKDEPMLAIYDEFSVYANDKIVDTVNKSRSAGFHCIIATQTLADLEKNDPYLGRQVVGNTNTYAIGQTNNPDEVESWASTLGTYKDIDLTVTTEKQEGRLKRVDLKADKGTLRHVQKFKISPDEIRDLRQGQFIFARKAAKEVVHPEIIYVRHPLAND